MFTLPIECANFTVPLDYSSPNSTETLTLELLKVPAAKTPSKGSVLLNFGGPGFTGRDTLASGAEKLQAITGGYHDLITFDPRGTGNALPYSCYKNDAERIAAGVTIQMQSGNASDIMPGRLWGLADLLVESCEANNKDTGSLIGTAFVARDMMRIVDALGEDGLLRYWGLSYGTTLGATVAAMFPDRMDRVILDGVQNPHEYYHGHDIEMFTDTDKTFAGVLSACVEAGPERCALAGSNRTAASLEKDVYSLMEELKQRPIPLSGILIDYHLVRGYILLGLYNPVNYPSIMALLDGLLSKNLTVITEAMAGSASVTASAGNDAQKGIQCGDKGADVSAWADPARNGFDKTILPAMEALNERSRLAGDTSAGLSATCGRWRTQAKERYTGDFNVKTKHPIMLIGSMFDPVTPLVSAKNVSEGFEGSVALQHNGFGHTSPAQISLCTTKAVQAYLVNGTLPEPGTVCEVDVPLFSNITWQDVLL
ncbi:alpha/beta-hydrolase [Lasiodiplodia theobromae]|nr:alpha/beta-hydrolase [Lasiodiplodia theobromae]